jgi:hypothetical protein
MNQDEPRKTQAGFCLIICVVLGFVLNSFLCFDPPYCPHTLLLVDHITHFFWPSRSLVSATNQRQPPLTSLLARFEEEANHSKSTIRQTMDVFTIRERLGFILLASLTVHMGSQRRASLHDYLDTHCWHILNRLATIPSCPKRGLSWTQPSNSKASYLLQNGLLPRTAREA